MPNPTVPNPTLLDPITFEVLRNAFIAVCNEMALVVAKSAYSTPVNEGRDFAGALYDRHGKLISQGEYDAPCFVGLTMLTVPEVMRAIGVDNMRPGDIYIINDPYVASTHCNDIHQVKPIFHQGDLIGFVTSTAHWSDVGGVAPGSLNARARTHFEEGVRIPAIRLYNAGVLNRDVVTILLANMRQSWERLGDLNAQTAAINAGESRLLALIAKQGLETVLASMDGVQDHSERLVRAAIAALPDGRYEAEDSVDPDVYTGEPKTIRLTLTVQGDHATFDLTASDGPAESGINGTIAATVSAVYIAMASILPPVPMNSGIARAVEVKAKRGSIVWAEPPSAISGLAATTMECVISSVMRALSQALPERGAGAPFSTLNTVFAGSDARPGFETEFIDYVWSFGGLGATKYKDGANDCAPSYGASCTNIPVELQERRYPVIWRKLQCRPDSGGPGRTRGGLALEQLLDFPYGPGTISAVGNREIAGPPGIFGGGPGGHCGVVANPGAESERTLGVFCSNAPVAPGETLSLWSGGGGGYGDPLARPPDAVLEDVIDGYVTIPAARSQYAVIVKEIDPRTLDYKIDRPATEKLRAQRRAAAPSG